MGIIRLGIEVLGFLIVIIFLIYMENQLWEIKHTVDRIQYLLKGENHIQYLIKGNEPD